MTPPAVHPAYESWSIRKPAVRAAGGIVTSQHHLASQVGARMLEAGGNAVDADLFGWPAVVEDRNVLGPLSIGVPGFVAGHAAALERFGTRSWRDAICLLDAWRHRLATMGDVDDSPAPGCTTHLSVADKDGNVVALTQTLLSIFDSRVVLPGTGILMNNGMMWFDPRPGRPNSIAPGKWPLSNMCPAIVERADGLRFAAGASGGRRIMPAVFQLVSFLVDYAMSMDDAMHTPRIDASGADLVTADRALAPDVVDALTENAPETGVASKPPAARRRFEAVRVPEGAKELP